MKYLIICIILLINTPCLGQRLIRGAPTQSREYVKQLDNWIESKKITLLDNVPDRPPQNYTTRPDQLETGMIVDLAYFHMQVIQVIGPTDMLIAFGNPEIPNLWLEQYPTKEIVDGDKIHLVGPVEITGTKTYTTINESNRTVRTIRLVPPTKPTKPTEKVVEDTKDYEAAKHRTWVSANGRFQVPAKYISYINGVVTLERDNGVKITLKIEQLSDTDQEFIRHRGWLK